MESSLTREDAMKEEDIIIIIQELLFNQLK